MYPIATPIPISSRQPSAQRLHTNHYVLPETARFNGGGWLDDSVPRLQRLRALARASFGTIDVATLKARPPPSF